ncbi:beta-ketoacyl synthase N-terminal-like domain-containing protein [Arhodomonas sp. AD133]|uniref:beta-ketoacyl synthase N-terminal-like domain-containing protein n=1 Tax=Arhodomonas sp. AD133 TaxID=3415009 RepID=UPI003EBEEDC7
MSQRSEPVAIVGAGCRFPRGGDGREGLWRVLAGGVDAVDATPSRRWDVERIHDPQMRRPGTTYCREGAFLDDVDAFDAAFFGLTAAEAREMDPQQRLLLEVAWEALADAGLPVAGLNGGRAAVYVGMLGMDYALLHAREAGVAGINPYYATGKEFSFGAGRLAYHLGSHGPAMTVNTACSSSLVAVHLACRSLAAGETDVALAGGVNLMLSPDLTVFMSQVRAISPTGRCRVFDAAADGIVRGEGCGVVVLKTLDRALADGDRVLAVIRGSAVNHDGASAGQTVPNATAQRAVIRDALAHAGVRPAEVGYVEAHGTGTPLGDPVELDALDRVFSADRDTPLLVGSMKANYGHMDAAAGVAGLIKTVEALRRRQVPGQLHVSSLTSAVDWERSALDVPLETTAWPGDGGNRCAGVSAFGLSGTNVHVVLSAHEDSEPAAGPVDGPLVLPVSARAGASLQALAGAYGRSLRAGDTAVADMLHTASCRRDHHDRRLAVVADGVDELAERLEGFAAGDAGNGVHTGVADATGATPVVFVYTGQGAQWAGMAADLLDTDPVFAATIRRCDAVLSGLADWRIEDELRREPQTSRLARTEIAQPVIFALQAALTERWRAWGVRPAAVVGHSMGEVAAAYAAGALTLEQALTVIFHRGEVMREAHGGGAMLAVGLDPEDAEARLSDGAGIEVAAVNAPGATVLAGDSTALEALAAELGAEGVFAVFVQRAYAFHSAGMTPYQQPLAAALAGLEVSEPVIPWLSTSGATEDTGRADVDYWVANIRRPVRFRDAVDRLVEGGHRLFLELGPHAVLTTPIHQCLARAGVAGQAISAIKRGQAGPEGLRHAVAALYCAGASLDWASLQPAGRCVSLPRYPWQHQRFWFESTGPGHDEGRLDPSRLTARVQVLDEAGRVVAGADDVALAGLADEGVESVDPSGVVPAGETPATPSSTVDPEAEVEAAVRELIGLPSDEPFDRDRGFTSLGLDSIAMVELRRMLQQRCGCDLPATVAFDYPDARRLGRFIAQQQQQQPVDADPPAPMTDSDRQDDPIAVVGIGCRFPGGVGSPEAFWELLMEHRCAVGPAPAQRWDVERYIADGRDGLPRAAAFVDDVAGFDADFFQISPREARSLDPQQRLFLEVAWEALERAGLPGDSLRESRTGVYAGLNAHDYELRVAADPQHIDAYYGTGNTFSAVAGRLSHFLGLQGPSLAVDTACSSSLTAIHLACQALRSGECDQALAGGVNVMAGPAIFLSMGEAGALAPDGRCKTFDDSADGYGRGEGCGIVVLKPLSRALADGDPVVATIPGSAINHDGPSSGLTVPNGPAQQALVREALDAARIAPSEVGYVEAHGTGTVLGDPIELQALDAVYRRQRRPDDPLRVGSVKTNIGHLEAAAGIAAFIKSCLAVAHGAIPAHLHLNQPNRRLDWRQLALRVPTSREPWEASAVERVAGVSAFGFTGTNVHVLLRGAESPRTVSGDGDADRPLPLVLSARSDDALRALACEMADFLRETDEPIEDICYTAALRRAALPVRLAFVARTAAGFADALQAWIAGNTADDDAPASAGVGALARRFMAGESVDWRDVWPTPGTVVGLPTYPWQHQPYWLPMPEHHGGHAAPVPSRSSRHPLLQHHSRQTYPKPAHVWQAHLADPGVACSLTATAHGDARLGYAALAAAVLAAVRDLLGSGRYALASVGFHAPLILAEARDRILEIRLTPVPEGEFEFRVASRASAGDVEFVHADGRVRRTAPPSGVTWAQPECPVVVEEDERDLLALIGFGPQSTVGRLECVCRCGGRSVMGVHLHEGVGASARHVNETLLESCLTLPAVLSAGDGEQPTVMACDELFVADGLPEDVCLWVAEASVEGAGEVVVTDRQGRVLIRAAGLKYADRATAVAEPTEADTYALHWDETELPDSVVPATGHWLWLEDEAGRAADAAQALIARGYTLKRLRSGSVYQSPGREPGTLDTTDQRHLVRLLREQGRDAGCRGIVHALGCGLPPDCHGPGESSQRACESISALARAISEVGGEGLPVWFLTEETQAVAGAPHRLDGAPVWGMARSFGLEHPGWWGGMVDVPLDDEPSVEALTAVLAGEPGHDHLALRDGRAYKATLVPDALARTPPPRLPAGSVALVHQPDPAVVAELAQWLGGLGVDHVAVIGTDAPLPEVSGVTFEALDVDAADAGALSRSLDAVRRHGPIAAVIHAGGDWRLRRLDEMHAGTVAEAFHGRVAGVAELHRQTAADPVALFVLFSSAASAWGAMGLGASAAADAYLDALAAYRHARALPALAVNWTQWESLVAQRPDDERLMRQGGLQPLTARSALSALERLLAAGRHQGAVAAADWSVLKPLYEGSIRWPVLDGVAGAVTAEADTQWWEQLRSLPPELRLDNLSRRVRAVTAEAFGFDDAAQVNPERGFFDMGMTSMMAVDLRARLERLTGTELPSTLAFEYTSVDAIARHLHDEHLGLSQAQSATAGDSGDDASESAPDTNAGGVDTYESLSETELLASLDRELSRVGELDVKEDNDE